MLWYKTWLETRSRFLIGLIVLMFSAGSTVLLYPQVAQLLPAVPETGARQRLRWPYSMPRRWRFR